MTNTHEISNYKDTCEQLKIEIRIGKQNKFSYNHFSDNGSVFSLLPKKGFCLNFISQMKIRFVVMRPTPVQALAVIIGG